MGSVTLDTVLSAISTKFIRLVKREKMGPTAQSEALLKASVIGGPTMIEIEASLRRYLARSYLMGIGRDKSGDI